MVMKLDWYSGVSLLPRLMGRSTWYIPPHGRNVRCKVALDPRSPREPVLDLIRFRTHQLDLQHYDQAFSVGTSQPARHANSPLNRNPINL